MEKKIYFLLIAPILFVIFIGVFLWPQASKQIKDSGFNFDSEIESLDNYEIIETEEGIEYKPISPEKAIDRFKTSLANDIRIELYGAPSSSLRLIGSGGKPHIYLADALKSMGLRASNRALSTDMKVSVREVSVDIGSLGEWQVVYSSEQEKAEVQIKNTEGRQM